MKGSKTTLNLLNNTGNLATKAITQGVIPAVEFSANQLLNASKLGLQAADSGLIAINKGLEYVNDKINNRELEIYKQQQEIQKLNQRELYHELKKFNKFELTQLLSMMDNLLKQDHSLKNFINYKNYESIKNNVHSDDKTDDYYKELASIIVNLSDNKTKSKGLIYNLISSIFGVEDKTPILNADIKVINNRMKMIQDEVNKSNDKDTKKLLALEYKKNEDLSNLLKENVKIINYTNHHMTKRSAYKHLNEEEKNEIYNLQEQKEQFYNSYSQYIKNNKYSDVTAANFKLKMTDKIYDNKIKSIQYRLDKNNLRNINNYNNKLQTLSSEMLNLYRNENITNLQNKYFIIWQQKFREYTNNLIKQSDDYIKKSNDIFNSIKK